MFAYPSLYFWFGRNKSEAGAGSGIHVRLCLHDYLKIGSVAEHAGINPGLLRQYASGVKYPSPDQAKKIEDALHHIANELQDVSIYA
jgi:hypothetical protein